MSHSTIPRFAIALVVVLAVLLALAFTPLGDGARSYICAIAFHWDIIRQNGRVRLYGRVVDQDGNGVPGVPVKGEVLVEDGFERGHAEAVSTQSDADGRFYIGGKRGTSLEITLSKEGYLNDPITPTSFSFKPDRPPGAGDSAQSPVIYRMWRKGPREPLVDIFFGRNMELVPDGRTYTVDLLGKTVHEGKESRGDLWVSTLRGDEGPLAGSFRYSYRVEVIDGGLAPCDDVFQFRAPESGYVPVFEFESRTTDMLPHDPTQRLYVRSRNGKLFSTLIFTIAPRDNGKAELDIGGWGNPAGSRNLECDHIITGAGLRRRE